MLAGRQAAVLAASAALFAASIGAQAATVTWDLSTFTQGATNQNNYGNSYSQTSGSVSLAVTAFATTGAGGGAGGTFETANIANWGSGSGLGVRSRSEGLNVSAPNHAVDNNGPTEILLLTFSESVVLTRFMIGWFDTDSDLSLVRWTNGAAPTITGSTIAGLIAGPWDLASHYSNVPADTFQATNVAQASRYWIVSAFDSGWGAQDWTADNDAFKFLKVTSETSGPPQEVPEPGSLALLALGVAGLAIMRRRRAA
jgi:hypothetical protein